MPLSYPTKPFKPFKIAITHPKKPFKRSQTLETANKKYLHLFKKVVGLQHYFTI